MELWRYISRRLFQIVIIFFVILTVLFLLFRLAPGDPVERMVDPTMTREDVQRLIAQCGDTPFTLHRAFDFSRDPLETLEQAVGLGCRYVLTMGQEREAVFSRELRCRILAEAGERINVVMALGADFDTAGDLETVVRDSGARQYHVVNGYRRRASEMRWAPNHDTESDYLRDTMFTVEYLSEPAVREVRDIFDRLEKGESAC